MAEEKTTAAVEETAAKAPAKKTAATKAKAASTAEKKPAAKKTAAKATGEAPAKKTAAKKAPAKKAATGSVTITLKRSLVGRNHRHIEIAQSLGLTRSGDVTTQPDNAATSGKIAKIAYLLDISKA